MIKFIRDYKQYANGDVLNARPLLEKLFVMKGFAIKIEKDIEVKNERISEPTSIQLPDGSVRRRQPNKPKRRK